MCGRAYRRHQLIRTPHSSHLVFVYQLLERPLHRLVPPHEQHVCPVQREQHQSLLPIYHVITKTVYQHQQADGVERAVTEQWPPRQRQSRAREQGAGSDHEQDVEDRRAHDGPDAHVVEGHEHSDDGGEEFWRGAPRRHERGPGDVVPDGQPLDDHVERRHEELVADYSQRHEHVAHADHVEYDRARASLFLGEYIRREEWRFLLEVCLLGGEVRRVGLAGPRRR